MTEPATPQEPARDPEPDEIREGTLGPEDDAAPLAEDLRDEGVPVAAGPERLGRSGAWTQSLTGPARLPGPAGLTYAEIPDRLIAFVLDLIALAIAGIILAIVVGGLFGGLAGGGPAAGGAIDSGAGGLNVGAFFVVGIVALAVSFAYFSYSWVVFRATPGMRLLGLRIGDQVDGRAVSWDQALVRWLVLGIAATLLTFVIYVPSIVGLVVALLGLAWLIVLLVSATRSSTNQGLHDRVARTIIVRAMRRAA